MPIYTLDELIEKMEPQSQRDKALINQCIGGLGLYAAQVAQFNSNSSKIDEMRKLVENLVGYWGLDAVEYSPSLEGYLEAFDEQIHAAKSGAEITGGTYRRHTDTIYGLHLYGEELIVCQGDEAMSEILDMSDLVKDIAEHWDFEPRSIVSNLTDKLIAEVRKMLEAIPLPGQPISGEQTGYVLKQAILFDNDRGFALAHNPKAPAPFVTWQFTNEEGKLNYYWGHYMASEDRARIDYISRATEYKESYKVTEKPIPTAAAEMGAEQNLNMIDGIRNNEAPSSQIQVQVLSESQPLVTVTFSENDELRNVTKMPLYLADKLFEELDEKYHEAYRQSGVDGAAYLKTDYRIDFILDGKPDSFSGQYNLGDCDGSLLYRIYYYNEWDRRDGEDYQQYLAGQGTDVQAAENARLDFIINKLVPYFEMHCELSDKEASAMSELMGIHDTAEGDSSDSAKVRITHLEAVVEQTQRLRAALNTTDLDKLPEFIRSAAVGVKDQPVLGAGEKVSVLEQIKASRQAPRSSAKRETQRDKKAHGPEL